VEIQIIVSGLWKLGGVGSNPTTCHKFKMECVKWKKK